MERPWNHLNRWKTTRSVHLKQGVEFMNFYSFRRCLRVHMRFFTNVRDAKYSGCRYSCWLLALLCICGTLVRFFRAFGRNSLMFGVYCLDWKAALPSKINSALFQWNLTCVDCLSFCNQTCPVFKVRVRTAQREIFWVNFSFQPSNQHWFLVQRNGTVKSLFCLAVLIA